MISASISCKNYSKKDDKIMIQPDSERNDILIVDDSQTSLKILIDLLMRHGYRVRPVMNGERALHVVRQSLPDLILLDIRMPGMDGYEVCRRLKAGEHTRDIPIIFISGLDDVVDKVRGFELGGVDYITKPFETAEVLARVKTQLSLHNMQRELQTQNFRLEQEISERKQTESALSESEERFSLFMDYLPAAVFIKDDESRTLYVNKYMNDVLGAKDWIGKTVLDLLPKDIAEAMIADDKKTLAEGYRMFAETVPDKHGINHIYQTHKFRITRTGKPPLMGGIALNITEIKQAEESLRKAHDELELRVRERTSELSEANRCLRREMKEREKAEKELRIERDNLENIFNAMSDGVCITDQQYDIRYANHAVEREFGSAESRKCFEYFHNLTEVCPWCKVRDVFSGKTVRWETESLMNRRVYELTSTPLRYSDDSIVNLEIFRDITDRKKTQKKLQRTMNTLNNILE